MFALLAFSSGRSARDSIPALSPSQPSPDQILWKPLRISRLA